MGTDSTSCGAHRCEIRPALRPSKHWQEGDEGGKTPGICFSLPAVPNVLSCTSRNAARAVRASAFGPCAAYCRVSRGGRRRRRGWALTAARLGPGEARADRGSGRVSDSNRQELARSETSLRERSAMRWKWSRSRLDCSPGRTGLPFFRSARDHRRHEVDVYDVFFSGYSVASSVGTGSSEHR